MVQVNGSVISTKPLVQCVTLLHIVSCLTDMLLGLSTALTWHEIENSGSKCFVKSAERGVIDESHDSYDQAEETSQEGQDHKSAGGVPVGCWKLHKRQVMQSLVTVTRCLVFVQFLLLKLIYCLLSGKKAVSHQYCQCVSCISPACSSATGPGACTHWTGGTASSSQWLWRPPGVYCSLQHRIIHLP